jgi:hypothetical protein
MLLPFFTMQKTNLKPSLSIMQRKTLLERVKVRMQQQRNAQLDSQNRKARASLTNQEKAALRRLLYIQTLCPTHDKGDFDGDSFLFAP